MPSFARILGVIVRDGPTKLVSFILAFVLWTYVSIGQSVLEIPKDISLELKNLPPDLVRVSDVPSTVNIKLLGSSAQLRSVEDAQLSYEIDLASATPGELSFKVIDTRIRGLAPGIRVTEISPSEITARFSERLEREVPVEVTVRGTPARGFMAGEKTAEPALVRVLGAREEVENMTAVPTEIIDITGLRKTYEGVHALDVVGRHVEVTDASEVRVRIEIDRDLAQREFSDIVVTVENTEWEYEVRPARIGLRLKGPTETMGRLTSETIRLVVDAAGLAPGKHTVRPQIVVSGDEDTLLVGLDIPAVTLELKENAKQTDKKGKKKK